MSKSWKSTLRLPRSSFPARPNPKTLQQCLRQSTDDLYSWQAHNRSAEEVFVLHDGPPYANGSLHVGHALNKILKDMIVRFKVQQGRRVIYRPGWDCHGLPIEMKALGSSSTKGLTPVQVRDTARKLASKTVKDQMKGFQAMGVMSDWENRWTTMDREYEVRQLRVFQNLVRRGLVYRKHKPVYWSISSRTALAEAELEYRDDHVSTAAYIKFPIISDWKSIPGLSQFQGDLYAAIWTTTPWTLPANKAIAVHDDMNYSVIQVGSDGLLIAASRLEAMREMIPEFDIVVDSIPGSQLKGLLYRNKLRGQSSSGQPILHADFVTAESGTGLVHMAPGHGQDDYETCSQVGIEAFAPINDAGIFTKEAYPDAPEKLTSAPSILDGGSQAVLELMADDVLGTHKLRHKYPYDWRTKKPVIVRATAQWFADVGSIKEDALAALRDVRFVPESGRIRLESFIKGRSEWCISRQRSWGVPIPALYDEAGNAVMTEESIDHIVSVTQQRGSSAWFSDASDDPAWIPSFLSGNYRRGTDTMDVWFDSGSSWTETSQRADVYLEGSDQHRGWFQSSLLTYVATHKGNGPEGVAPFKNLITHGFTLDSQGKKMSKSLGNIIMPDQVMDGSLLGPAKGKGKGGKGFDGLGSDALRLWAASADFTSDVLIGQTILQPIHTALIKYRTIIKMLLGSLNQQARTAPLTKLDQIALLQLSDTMAQVAEAFDNFEFHRATSMINRWVATDLSAFYLEALKDRLYCGDGGGVLEPIFIGFLRMLAPITPLLVEEAWLHRPTWMADDTSLVSPARQLYSSDLVDASRLTVPREELRDQVPIISEVHSAVKATLELARTDKVLGSSLQSSVYLSVQDSRVAAVLERNLDELDAMFVVSSVDVNGTMPENPGWSYAQDYVVQNAQVKDAIDALNSLQTPFEVIEARRKAGIKPDAASIKEMRAYLHRIGYTPADLDRLNIVHVAGTKGKGSTCAFVDCILAKYQRAHSVPRKTGLFISPHLIAVRERIRINSTPISEELFAKYFFEVWDRLASSQAAAEDAVLGTRPIYARYLTLMSWHVFLQEGIDVAVYETGIGGEYDATNIVERPVASGISTLGIDHVFALGDTVEKIAWHKAGIMKTGSPAFTIEQVPGAAEVLKNRAAEKQVDLKVLNVDPRLSAVKIRPDATFQKRNATLAVALAETALEKLGILKERDAKGLPKEFVDGLERVVWRGRCEVKAEDKVIWHVDGAHTSDSLKMSSKWFNGEICGRSGPRILIFNQQGRSEAVDFLDSLHKATRRDGQPAFDHVIFCTNVTYAATGYKRDFVNHQYDPADIEKMTVQRRFADKWTSLDPRAKVMTMATIEQSIEYARHLGDGLPQGETVQAFITGSLHLVGGALGILEKADAL